MSMNKTQSPPVLTSELDAQDYQDIIESDPYDVATSVTKTTIIWEHPDLGLHGIEVDVSRGHIRPVSVEPKADYGLDSDGGQDD
jgi:hypothetical protein